MAFKIVFLEEFGQAFVPKRFIPYLREYLLKAGISNVPYKIFGALFYLTAVITGSLYIFFIYPFLLQYNQLILLVTSAVIWSMMQLSLAAVFILVIYFYIDIRIYKRTKKMEDLLPDFLQVVSSNLKGGMSFENALWGAIKPRFSILANEMAEISKKVMTGHDVSTALSELSKKYNSPMLRRSIDLMISELESGGQISDLIDKIVDNFKETKSLKADISASAVAYTMFIGAIVIFIAPLLFALSFHLLIIILNFVARLSAQTSKVESIPISFTDVAVDPATFKIFSVVALLIISFFSSLIVSIVEKGNIKGGLKFIPIFMAGSVAFYFVFLKVLTIVFKGLTI
jgi:pilus assembly protein TadC